MEFVCIDFSMLGSKYGLMMVTIFVLLLETVGRK